MGNIANQWLADKLGNAGNGNPKKKVFINTVVLIVFLALLFIILNKLGVLESHSGTRIGYVSNGNSYSWNAHYSLLNGTESKKITPNNDELSVQIKTESGSINVLIEGENGEKFYQGQDLDTCSFKVKTEGKVKITIKASNHKGSFSFE